MIFSIRLFLHSVALLLSLSSLSGCVHTNTLAGHNSYQNPGHVLIGLSTGIQPDLMSLEVDIESTNKGIPGLIRPDKGVFRLCRPKAMLNCEELDYKDDSEVGIVIARRLPAGQYKITGVRVGILETGGFGLFSLNTTRRTTIKFDIEAGKTSYLGRFHIADITGSNERLYPKRNAEVIVTDRHDADLAFATRKLPLLPTDFTSYLPDEASSQQLLNLSKHIARIRHPTAPVLLSDVSAEQRARQMPCEWWC